MLLVAGIAAVLLLLGSVVLLRRHRSLPCLMQVVGVAGVLVVVLAHAAETFGLLAWMGWGQEHSAGHYLDLIGAVMAAVLFPLGYAWHALARSGV